MLYYIIIHIIRYIYIYIYKYHMCIAPVYGKLQSTIQWKNAVFHDTTKKNKKNNVGKRFLPQKYWNGLHIKIFKFFKISHILRPGAQLLYHYEHMEL